MANNALQEAVDDYLEHVDAHSRRATVTQYRWSLAVFLRWADKEGLTAVSDITVAVLDRYARALRDEPGPKGRKLSDTTRATYTRGLSLFLKWANLAGPRPQPVRQTDKPLDVLTPAEVGQLIAAAPTPRDRLIISLLANTGMRLGELINLRLGDRMRDGGQTYLRLRGKTGSRDVAISRDVARQLDSYVSSSRLGSLAGRDHEPVFLARRLRGRQEQPLTVSGVQQLVRHAGAEAGIHKRVYPHLLRHTYATHYLAEGGDSVMLQKVLGHTSLAMISRTYSHPTREHLGKAMLDFVKKRDGSNGNR